ncbi:CD320 antigen [Tamandua tetradactyla]|uniref:CD320 antigen n=1 Tax=Tamandua tetradactyla TaxID=48850 RepID=UPI004054879F
MERRRARRTAALALALRLLLGLGPGLEAAPTSAGTATRIGPTASASGPSPGSCAPTDFQCLSSGLCVPLAWRCDGDQDCLDGSDEGECEVEPCDQNGQCSPPSSIPCSCDSARDCPGHPCNPSSCSADQLRCRGDGACIPGTWRCDGHRDCPDASDEQGCGTAKVPQGWNATSMGTPATHEMITYLRNATTTSVRDQGSEHSENQSAYGIMAAAAVLSAGLAAAALLLLCRLCTQGHLMTSMKDSLWLLELKTSLL